VVLYYAATWSTRRTIRRLHGVQRENAVLITSRGVSTVYLAVGLGRSACRAGYRAALRAARVHAQLNAFQKRLQSYDRVSCDEFGYIPFSADG
jgi:hypothetical protein